MRPALPGLENEDLKLVFKFNNLRYGVFNNNEIKVQSQKESASLYEYNYKNNLFVCCTIPFTCGKKDPINS